MLCGPRPLTRLSVVYLKLRETSATPSWVPKAETYRQGRWQEFFTYVREARGLVQKLPSTVGPEIGDEWQIVEKGILKRGKHELGWIL